MAHLADAMQWLGLVSALEKIDQDVVRIEPMSEMTGALT
jgi:hypothetical protein